MDGLITGVSVAVFAATAAIFETTTGAGRRQGLAGGAGGATGDGLWAVAFVALDGAANGLRSHWSGFWKWAAVAALLLVGASVVRNLVRRNPLPIWAPGQNPASAARTYRSFLVRSLTDPVTAIFFVSLMITTNGAYAPAAGAAFVGGVFAASLCWQFGLALLTARRGGPLSDSARRRLSMLDCVLLTIFVVYIVLAT